MATATFARDNVRLRVLKLGSGAPLLYLHGFERHPGEDASFLWRLAESHTVIAPELPGYGESTGIDEICDIFDLVLLLRALVEAHADGPVAVAGHSLGGMLAAEFAALCPQLVSRLVLVDAYGLWLEQLQLPDPFVLTDAELKKAKWANPEAETAVESSWSADLGPDAGEAALSRMQNLGSATKFMWPIPDRGLSRRLGYVTAPTLVVHGAADGLVPVAYANELAGRIPGATVAIVDGAGHLPMLEREDEFLSLVGAHLAG